jgi:glucan-binding YG repeat protein/GH25 family lysozyme M1 (1,4-beta-N-acetylmuramidase)
VKKLSHGRIGLVIVMLTVALLCLTGLRVYNGYVFFFDLPDRSGWTGEGDARRYLDHHAGVVTDTLLEIDSKKYYFTSDGSVHKGELELDGNVYYFDEATGVMRTGWVERGGARYYYWKETGVKAVDDVFTIDGGEFMFDVDGAEVVGPVEIEGKQYYFDKLTGMLKNVEKQLNGAWYYYAEDGARFGTGWAEPVEGRICYYDGDAGMLFGEQTIDGQPYLLDISLGGRLTGTVYFDGMVYTIDEKGVVQDKQREALWNGIDVSWHQGPEIDWAAVKESGVQFVLVRAGYIASEERPVWMPDEYFARNVHGAQAQGISVGAYIYLYNSTEEGLADGIDAFAAGAEVARVKLDLPVFLDVEDKEYFKTGSDALGGFDYRTGLVRFGLERLESLGFEAGFYTFSNWAGKEFDTDKLYEEGYPFWLARWYNNNADMDPETLAWNDDKQPTVWQYRATGQVGGIEKEVDRDYLYWDRMP